MSSSTDNRDTSSADSSTGTLESTRIDDPTPSTSTLSTQDATSTDFVDSSYTPPLVDDTDTDDMQSTPSADPMLPQSMDTDNDDQTTSSNVRIAAMEQRLHDLRQRLGLTISDVQSQPRPQSESESRTPPELRSASTSQTDQSLPLRSVLRQLNRLPEELRIRGKRVSRLPSLSSIKEDQNQNKHI